MKDFLLILALFLGVSCSSKSFLKERNFESFSDDLPLSSLVEALKSVVNHVKSAKLTKERIKLGKFEIDRETYTKSLEDLANFLAKEKNLVKVYQYLKDNFYFLEVESDREDHEILLTSYYAALIKGSFTPHGSYKRAIYRTPDNTNFTRKQIDEENALKGQNLEICYVDPIDAFFLQMQGSGVIDINGKKISVGFDGSNDQPYVSIGKLLSDKEIPKDKITLHTVENYLRKLPPKELQSLLNQNTRYVFFKRQSHDKPITTFGNPAFDGRTIATDGAIFPKGLLAYITFKKPTLKPGTDEVLKTDEVSRLVIDQDTGSAIKGTGRIDLFWGKGAEAKKYAGVVKSPAKLVYLLPKVNSFGHSFQ